MLSVPIQALFGQLLLGLINGAFYALLSLGLAIIFGLLNVINFAHGAQYMLGAFGAGTIDPNGRKRHAMYVYEIKRPDESKSKWDVYKLIRAVPAEQAFRAPADSGCPLVAK